jgi:hypothetical protein
VPHNRPPQDGMRQPLGLSGQPAGSPVGPLRPAPGPAAVNQSRGEAEGAMHHVGSHQQPGEMTPEQRYRQGERYQRDHEHDAAIAEFSAAFASGEFPANLAADARGLRGISCGPVDRFEEGIAELNAALDSGHLFEHYVAYALFHRGLAHYGVATAPSDVPALARASRADRCMPGAARADASPGGALPGRHAAWRIHAGCWPSGSTGAWRRRGFRARTTYPVRFGAWLESRLRRAPAFHSCQPVIGHDECPCLTANGIT